MLMLINEIALEPGWFGFNGNIFETNIINLAVVIGIVVIFVGGNLTTLLEDRKIIILNNLQEANHRAIEAQEKLNQARAQLESAKNKAQNIREEGTLRVTQEINNCVIQHEMRLARLQEFQPAALQQAEQKAFKQAYMYLIKGILKRVRERLNIGLDSTSHIVVNNCYVSRFSDYKVKPLRGHSRKAA